MYNLKNCIIFDTNVLYGRGSFLKNACLIILETDTAESDALRDTRQQDLQTIQTNQTTSKKNSSPLGVNINVTFQSLKSFCNVKVKAIQKA